MTSDKSLNNKDEAQTKHGNYMEAARKPMPEDDTLYELAELFKIFGDNTRIKIIAALLDGEMCVYHLSEFLGMGQSAVSHQLRILKAAGLVRPRREGKTVFYSLDDEHVEMIFSTGLKHVRHKSNK